MNKTITFFVVCFWGMSLFAQTDLNKGLVAYYPFNGNADDSTAFKNHAIDIHASLTFGHDGSENAAYCFNGTSDYIEFAHQEQINFTGIDTFAVSIWFKSTQTDDAPNGSSILSKWSESRSESYPFRIMLAPYNYHYKNRVLVARFSNDRSWCAGSHLLPGVSEVNDSAWHHLVLQKNTNGLMELYVDGKLEANYLDEFECSLENTSNLVVGYRDPTYSSTVKGFFTGSLDELRMYNRSLSKKEIKLLFGKCSETRIDTVKLVLSEISFTAVGEALAQHQFSVYPNPSSDIIYIKHENLLISSLKVYGMDGRLVYEAQPSDKEVSVDVNKLNGRGAYVFKLVVDNKEVVLKGVIE